MTRLVNPSIRVGGTDMVVIPSSGTAGHNHPENVTAWQTPAYESNWQDYVGSDLQALRFRRNRDMVELQGLIESVGAPDASSDNLFTLPEGYRPTERLLVGCMVGHPTTGWAYQRIDIWASGVVRYGFGWNGGNTAGIWLDFTGLRFAVGMATTQ